MISEIPVWHLNGVNGSEGPLSREEIARRLASGVITFEWYVWREGFTEWKQIADCDEFSVTPSAPAPNIHLPHHQKLEVLSKPTKMEAKSRKTMVATSAVFLAIAIAASGGAWLWVHRHQPEVPVDSSSKEDLDLVAARVAHMASFTDLKGDYLTTDGAAITAIGMIVGFQNMESSLVMMDSRTAENFRKVSVPLKEVGARHGYLDLSSLDNPESVASIRKNGRAFYAEVMSKVNSSAVSSAILGHKDGDEGGDEMMRAEAEQEFQSERAGKPAGFDTSMFRFRYVRKDSDRFAVLSQLFDTPIGYICRENGRWLNEPMMKWDDFVVQMKAMPTLLATLATHSPFGNIAEFPTGLSERDYDAALRRKVDADLQWSVSLGPIVVSKSKFNADARTPKLTLSIRIAPLPFPLAGNFMSGRMNTSATTVVVDHVSRVDGREAFDKGGADPQSSQSMSAPDGYYTVYREIQLISGTTENQIKEIAGRVILSLPVGIERLDVTTRQKSISSKDGTFVLRVTEWKENRISMAVRGGLNTILAVVGVTEDDSQITSSSSGFRGGMSANVSTINGKLYSDLSETEIKRFPEQIQRDIRERRKSIDEGKLDVAFSRPVKAVRIIHASGFIERSYPFRLTAGSK